MNTLCSVHFEFPGKTLLPGAEGHSKSRNEEMRNEKWEMRKWENGEWGNEEMGKWEANC